MITKNKIQLGTELIEKYHFKYHLGNGVREVKFRFSKVERVT